MRRRHLDLAIPLGSTTYIEGYRRRRRADEGIQAGIAETVQQVYCPAMFVSSSGLQS
jgi:hypothetical protein